MDKDGEADRWTNSERITLMWRHALTYAHKHSYAPMMTLSKSEAEKAHMRSYL